MMHGQKNVKLMFYRIRNLLLYKASLIVYNTF